MNAQPNTFANQAMGSPMTLADEQWQNPIDFGALIDDSQRRESTDTVPLSEPHTPVEQLPIPGQPFYKRSEYSSVSSFATTEDEDGINEIKYPWSAEQDDLVRMVYQKIIDSPLATPFSSRYPPSGVLHQVAKKTQSAARRHDVHFPHSMDAIRRRVLLLLHQAEDSGNKPPEMELSFSSYFGQFTPKRSEPVVDDFDFSENVATPKGRVGEKYMIAHSGHPGLLPESLRQIQALAPPFKEQPAQPTISGDPFSEEGISLSARRKRDSFRFKRGQL